MKFHLDARTLLKRATQLALLRGASQVEVEHLLECDPETEPTEAIESKDIPFSQEMQQLLERAFHEAQEESVAIITRRHFTRAAIFISGKRPDWSQKKNQPALTEVLDEATCRLLAAAQVDVDALKIEIDGLSLQESRPQPAFRYSEAGNRYHEILERLTDVPEAGPLLLLLGCLLCDGPASKRLATGGLSEGLLIEILERMPRDTPPPPSVDFSQCLGPGVERLTPEARCSLEIAWQLRDAPEMQGQHLLRGLLGCGRLLKQQSLCDLLAELPGLEKTTPYPVENEPSLSSEMYQVIGAAFKLAGPDQPVSNVHLLLALAECGQAGPLTPARVRERLL